MNGDIGAALQLLGVGMLTVFIILTLVVIVGSLIIKFVNRYMPETAMAKVASKVSTAIHPQKMAAIVSAVQSVTKGKGRVIRVEKK